MAENFTQSKLPEVEQRIGLDQVQIATAVAEIIPAQHLVAIVMIGGYARSEGGYLCLSKGPQAYNDYDYFVIFQNCSKSQMKIFAQQLNERAKTLEIAVCVEVDFFPLMRTKIRSLPFTLMYAEMRMGHKVIYGDQDVLASMPTMPLNSLPLKEMQRLMLNRGTLLLLNKIHLMTQNDWDRDQFNKYMNKAALACGDSYLHQKGLYDLSYTNKLARLRKQDSRRARRLLPHYERAVQHKLHPQQSLSERAELIRLQNEISHLWKQEFEYLSQQILDFESKTRLPEKLKKGTYNLCINLRDRGLDALREPSDIFEYPREWLYRTLPRLLFDQDLGVQSQSLSAINEVDSSSSYDHLTDHYFSLWHRYS